MKFERVVLPPDNVAQTPLADVPQSSPLPSLLRYSITGKDRRGGADFTYSDLWEDIKIKTSAKVNEHEVSWQGALIGQQADNKVQRS